MTEFKHVVEFMLALPPAEQARFLRAAIDACEHNNGPPSDPETLAQIEDFKLRLPTGEDHP